jgi:hypothetical protein
MQGGLFTGGIFFLGNTLLGRVLGALFASVWGFVQPCLFYYLAFGKEFFYSLLFWSNRFLLSEKSFFLILLGLVFLKMIAAGALVLASQKISQTRLEEWILRLPRKALPLRQKQGEIFSWKKATLGSIKDLMSPLYLASWVITLLFISLSGHPSEETIHGILRPLGVGFIGFFSLRVFSSLDIFKKLRHKKLSAFRETWNLFGGYLNRSSKEG